VNSTSIVSTLLDPVRLMVAGSLAGRARTVASIAGYTGVDERDVVAAIGALRQVGLVEQSEDGYTLPAASLRRLASELAETDVPMDPWVGFGMTDDEHRPLLAQRRAH
jgi:DNA-binding transcriptional ArsR family regulator